MNTEDIAKWCDTRAWIFHTIKFIHEMKIDIHPDHTQLCPQCNNDKVIMDLALSFTSNPTELKAIYNRA